nr:vicilin-like seed storage protein At2g18540 [Halyomorpha halys]
MATEKKSTPGKETKEGGETVARKDEVKVTNLLSEIRTTDLPKESPMQVDTDKEKEKNQEVEIIDEEKGKEQKGVKDAEKVEESDNVDKKVEEAKKEDDGEKKEEEIKKKETEENKTDDAKTAEKSSKKPVIKKVESEDKKDNSKILPKEDKTSPLAAFFKDWDKFTSSQKRNIEQFVRDKAEKMGAPATLKPGVRTPYERERNRYTWNAMMRRRESRRRIESLRIASRSLRDRRPSPRRLRGAGDSRSRGRRDDRRWSRYSPRREEPPWRSPWASSAAPVETLMKQMERFVQMVNKFPSPNNVIHEGPKRLALLPTPPNGYNLSSRLNALHDVPMEDKSRNYTEKAFAPPPRWPVESFPIKSEEPSRRFFGKEPSSQRMSKQRATPYDAQPAYPNGLRSDNWSNRERTFSQTPVAPYQESRYNRRRN